MTHPVAKILSEIIAQETQSMQHAGHWGMEIKVKLPVTDWHRLLWYKTGMQQGDQGRNGGNRWMPTVKKEDLEFNK